MTNLLPDGSIADPFSNYIALSRYARWIEEKGRREVWSETVDRYLSYMTDKLGDSFDYSPDQSIVEEIRGAIYNLDLVPSMRALMTAGPALERSGISAYNPVSGDTEVLTREYGMVPIAKLSGETATVLNVEGRWAPAHFRSYGPQETFSVEIKNRAAPNFIEATANHRWVKSDGTVVPTSGLKVGDEIPFSSAPRPDTNNIDYDLGVIHGLIYGDGTTTYSQERLSGYHIRICTDHELTRFFNGHGKICYPPSANGDPVVQLYGSFAKTHDLKSLPSSEETLEYLLGFIRGWMAADGSISKVSQSTLATTQDGLDWFYQNAPRVGIVPVRHNAYPDRTNFGDRKRKLFRIHIDRRSLIADDFIVERKRDRFSPYPCKTSMTVRSVVPTGRTEEVFCAEVPDTNTFVVKGGIVTGNCAYTTLDSPRAFSELLYILMNGTGVGYSVEKMYIDQLPPVPELNTGEIKQVTVADSKEGWAEAFDELLGHLWDGYSVMWDLSQVRPEGARLKTFGGRASGPQPLDDLFRFTSEIFAGARGRKLRPIEAHDIACMVAKCIVSGGVRRSAMISLSDLDDVEMANAKSGEWWKENDHRALANNSAVYYDGMGHDAFIKEWDSLVSSGSGERGIFNRDAARRQASRFGRDADTMYGTNPCSEIILKPNQFCNLSEVIVRSGDSFDDLRRKIELATVLGTWQSTISHFPYLRDIWKKNTEDERLLGVSLTGVFGNTLLNHARDGLSDTLSALRASARNTNRIESGAIGIRPSHSITCVKPSGTVSQLAKVSSGLHPWHSEQYIRTIRESKTNPLSMLMEDCGIPVEEDSMNDTNNVFSFPVKAPGGSVVREDLSAIDHLEMWLTYQRHYCEHKPSVTISVKEDEWKEVGEWVWKHLDEISGVSFLPFSEHTYEQAPYQEVSVEEYERAKADFPEVYWGDLSFYELQDSTEGSQELACSANGCEIK